MAKRGQPVREVVQGNMVRMRNNGTEPFRGRYRQQWFTLPPNVEAFLEYGAAVTWLGNPLLTDTAKDKERSREFHRIKLLHMGAENVYNDLEWSDRRPKLEVYTLDGKKLHMVADDPQGQTVNLGEDPSVDQIQKQFLMLQSTMAAWAQKLAESGVEVELPEFNLTIPAKVIPDDSPNRPGSFNAPIILGPDSDNQTIAGLVEADDFDSDDLVPSDDGGVRKVTEVAIDDAKKKVRTISGSSTTRRNLGED